jgi:hypothetical protein
MLKVWDLTVFAWFTWLHRFTQYWTPSRVESTGWFWRSWRGSCLISSWYNFDSILVFWWWHLAPAAWFLLGIRSLLSQNAFWGFPHCQARWITCLWSWTFCTIAWKIIKLLQASLTGLDFCVCSARSLTAKFCGPHRTFSLCSKISTNFASFTLPHQKGQSSCPRMHPHLPTRKLVRFNPVAEFYWPNVWRLSFFVSWTWLKTRFKKCGTFRGWTCPFFKSHPAE